MAGGGGGGGGSGEGAGLPLPPPQAASRLEASPLSTAAVRAVRPTAGPPVGRDEAPAWGPSRSSHGAPQPGSSGRIGFIPCPLLLFLDAANTLGRSLGVDAAAIDSRGFTPPLHWSAQTQAGTFI